MMSIPFVSSVLQQRICGVILLGVYLEKMLKMLRKTDFFFPTG